MNKFKPRHVLSFHDDTGDIRGMRKIIELRERGAFNDAILVGVNYPEDAQGCRPNETVFALADYVALDGVGHHCSFESKNEKLTGAQRTAQDRGTSSLKKYESVYGRSGSSSGFALEG